MHSDFPGRLVSFEGPEGGGKSTQARLLAEKLRAAGLSVLATREPGGTPTGEIIRDLLQNVLAPALARGEWVVLDRFTDSTLAYQGYGRGFDVETLRAMNGFATGPVRPDLTILLDIPVEAGLGRAVARSGARDRIESAPIDFHRRLREGYLELARREPGRFAVVDASAPVDAVSAKVWEAVRSRLSPGA